MRNSTKRIALPLAVAAALAAGPAAGGALATGPGKGHATAKHAATHRAARGLLKAITDYLELTPKQLREQLRSGKSLAQVATAQSKSVDGLKKVIVDAARARLDRAVAAKKLSPEREQRVLDRLAAHVDEFVNRTWPVAGR